MIGREIVIRRPLFDEYPHGNNPHPWHMLRLADWGGFLAVCGARYRDGHVESVVGLSVMNKHICADCEAVYTREREGNDNAR